MSTRQLPPKVPKPDLTGYHWDWKARYFDVGEKIDWIGCHGGALCTGYVGKVAVNKFGRVSYYSTRGEFILTEDVQRAAQYFKGAGK